jgi:YVTN family beta-propeller protein
MKLSVSSLLATTIIAVSWLTSPSLAQNAYITNNQSNFMSVINTVTNQVTATIPLWFIEPRPCCI